MPRAEREVAPVGDQVPAVRMGSAGVGPVEADLVGVGLALYSAAVPALAARVREQAEERKPLQENG